MYRCRCRLNVNVDAWVDNIRSNMVCNTKGLQENRSLLLLQGRRTAAESLTFGQGVCSQVLLGDGGIWVVVNMGFHPCISNGGVLHCSSTLSVPQFCKPVGASCGQSELLKSWIGFTALICTPYEQGVHQHGLCAPRAPLNKDPKSANNWLPNKAAPPQCGPALFYRAMALIIGHHIYIYIHAHSCHPPKTT